MFLWCERPPLFRLIQKLVDLSWKREKKFPRNSCCVDILINCNRLLSNLFGTSDISRRFSSKSDMINCLSVAYATRYHYGFPSYLTFYIFQAPRLSERRLNQLLEVIRNLDTSINVWKLPFNVSPLLSVISSRESFTFNG